MEVFILTPTSPIRSTGNRGTAYQWASMLEKSGYSVAVGSELPEPLPDLLVVLHAGKCHDAAIEFKRRHPSGKLIVGLTGTDIYPAPGEAALESMRFADALIALQSQAPEQIPIELRKKTHVIVQSAEQIISGTEKNADGFRVCVVGHLRNVKDPLLTAKAARLLPAESKIQVFHAGGILEPEYEALVESEMAENPRYHWLGEQSPEETSRLLATSQLMVLSSHSEGGGRVVGEAIVHGTPVLSTRIDGIVGLLGEDYPGFYPVGDAESLATLLQRCETDHEFFAHLQSTADPALFSPETESRLLSELVDSLVS